MSKAKHKSRGHVLDPNELKITRVVIHVDVAQPAARGMILMIDNSGWHIYAFPSCKLSPKTQISILAVKKKIIVQKTYLLKHLPAIKCSSSAGTKHWFLRVIKRYTRSEPAIKPHSSGCNTASSAVNFLRALYDEFGGTNANVRIFKHRSKQVFKPCFIRLGVVVNKSNKVSSCYLKSLYIPTRKALVFRQLNDL